MGLDARFTPEPISKLARPAYRGGSEEFLLLAEVDPRLPPCESRRAGPGRRAVGDRQVPPRRRKDGRGRPRRDACEREVLERLVRRHNPGEAIAAGACIVLQCASGSTNTEVAEGLGVTKQDGRHVGSALHCSPPGRSPGGTASGRNPRPVEAARADVRLPLSRHRVGSTSATASGAIAGSLGAGAGNRGLSLRPRRRSGSEPAAFRAQSGCAHARPLPGELA